MAEKQNTPEIRFEGFTDPWEQRKLGELGLAQSGIGFPDTEQGGAEGTPFFKVSDMNMPGNEHELVASNNYVTPEQIARMGWHPISQVPAIFFAKVGAAVMLNRKRLINKPFLLDNNTMAFSMDSSLLNAQFGQSLFERIDLTSLIQIGALPSYNSSDVESITVSLPSTMDEQCRIGQCLCNMNDLITLHQRARSVPLSTSRDKGGASVVWPGALLIYDSFIDLISQNRLFRDGRFRMCRYPRPIPKMLASSPPLSSGASATSGDTFVCNAFFAGASTGSPSARKNSITSLMRCCRDSLSSP